MNRLLRQYLELGNIVNPLPNNIADGQAADAVPVMQNFNSLVSQVNSNAYSQADVNNLLAALGTPLKTYTPVLAFGGASVGITYSAQEGFWKQFGKAIFVMGRMGISAVGSSTGQATISLPAPFITAAVGIHMPISMSVIFANFTGLANQVVGRVIPNTSTVVPSSMSTSNNQTMVDFGQLNVQAGTEFSWGGWYPTN